MASSLLSRMRISRLWSKRTCLPWMIVGLGGADPPPHHRRNPICLQVRRCEGLRVHEPLALLLLQLPAVALTVASVRRRIHAAEAALARESGLLVVFWKDCGREAHISFFVEIIRPQVCVDEDLNLCGWMSFTSLTKWASLTSCLGWRKRLYGPCRQRLELAEGRVGNESVW
jgi:hypothetical protein